MKFLQLVSLLILLAFAQGGTASEIMSNDDVIQMHALGLSDVVIITKIENTPGDFDTSLSGLQALQDAGVSDAVISTLITRDSGAGELEAAQARMGGEMSWVHDDEWTTMTGVQVHAENSQRKRRIPVYGAHAAPETFYFIDGKHATLRMAEDRPVFHTTLEPHMVKMVELGHHRRRGNRFVVFSASSTDRSVTLQSTALSGGVYQLTPQHPLQAGEYALFVAAELKAGEHDSAFARGVMNFASTRMPLYRMAYDFGVD